MVYNQAKKVRVSTLCEKTGAFFLLLESASEGSNTLNP